MLAVVEMAQGPRGEGPCNWPGCREVWTQVDHITPRIAGGGDEPENLQGLCQAHNAQKGDGRAHYYRPRPPAPAAGTTFKGVVDVSDSRARAEFCIDTAAHVQSEAVADVLAEAQVHATLALVTALDEIGAELYRVRVAIKVLAGDALDREAQAHPAGGELVDPNEVELVTFATSDPVHRGQLVDILRDPYRPGGHEPP